ncbi:PD-(D/E)XK nuclease family protein [uncultured Dokdonia sp.]|uniref:PDDEXK-like family protein n=1 Tax=Dokdonia sp. R78006 TaxID=3093866 RepID=UPI0026317B11|nr:PD-(D/E)XK nuclease family protein [uncultured Dokdonia sp.]
MQWPVGSNLTATSKDEKLMKSLLEKIKILNYKYETLKTNDNFNVFKILRKYNDEVNLHSKFICELLNPKGSHGFNDLFLRLFIEIIKNKTISISEKTKVHNEKNIGPINENKTKGGQIDILIENQKGNSIIIENKIHAGDQENQLLRYKNFNKNAEIYYLTLKGNEPSQFSLGTLNLSEIICISYTLEIRDWIKLCIEKTSIKPKIRETLTQYLQLINELTGETSLMEERLELIELLGKNNNIIPASKIAENWVHIKWHTEFDFWNDLEEIIKRNSKYEITEIQKFSENNLSSVIHKSRGKNPWYGILFKIYKIENLDYCIFIERGNDNVYFGLLILNENKERVENSNTIHKKISLALSKSVEWNNINWLGVKYLEPKINFELFNQETTLKLVNKEYRTKYLEKNWKIIEDFIKLCEVEIKTATNKELS